jgi:hypothetical protein
LPRDRRGDAEGQPWLLAGLAFEARPLVPLSISFANVHRAPPACGNARPSARSGPIGPVWLVDSVRESERSCLDIRRHLIDIRSRGAVKSVRGRGRAFGLLAHAERGEEVPQRAQPPAPAPRRSSGRPAARPGGRPYGPQADPARAGHGPLGQATGPPQSQDLADLSHQQPLRRHPGTSFGRRHPTGAAALPMHVHDGRNRRSGSVGMCVQDPPEPMFTIDRNRRSGCSGIRSPLGSQFLPSFGSVFHGPGASTVGRQAFRALPKRASVHALHSLLMAPPDGAGRTRR